MNSSADRADSGQSNAARKPWVEPEVVELAIESTAMFPRQRGDGGNYPDCRRS